VAAVGTVGPMHETAADLEALQRLLDRSYERAGGHLKDGIFYRGAFWFGSAPDSVRFRHIRARPDVSATHIEGEPFAVTVHGRAHQVDLRDPAVAGFRAALEEVYAPRYGGEWIGWAQANPYARIEARRMYTFSSDAV
jgi:hypothetical protein